MSVPPSELPPGDDAGEPRARAAAAPRSPLRATAPKVREAARRLLENLLPSRRARMVGWYDPRVLAQSAWLMTVANIFGRHSDTRLLEALATQSQPAFRLEPDADGNGDFWLDFVADLGDGWNSTYAIAHALAQTELVLRTPEGEAITTRGGAALVFGGDEVYPYPSRDAYALRTEAPYATAFEGAGRHPQVFAVPGNHDWYDSLVAFSRVFCRPERGFAGCETRQTRSYFALELPHDWWLLAIDLQLGADMDEPQVRYFQEVAARMPPGARVILCVPEPQWIYEKSYPGLRSYSDAVLRFFVEQVLGRPVAMYLTGDLHYYKRHEDAAGVQKVVAGGGGAFLHPTHAPDTAHLHGGFREKACYPDARTSRRLAWWNLAFPFLNPQFLWIPAVMYMLSNWFASATLGATDVASLGTAFQAAVHGAVRYPLNGLWLLGLIAAVVFFTDTHVRWYRVLGGIGHAIAHLAAAFGLGWLSVIVTTHWLGLAWGSLAQMLLSAAITFAGGGVAGAVVLGLYLILSLQLFGRHGNEAFSSLRIQDHKSWLRMRIDAAGELTVHAIAIDRVARHWAEREVAGRRQLVPWDAAATAPRLIERFTLRRR